MRNIISTRLLIICTGAVGLLLTACQTVEFPEPKETGSSTPQFLFQGSAGGNTLNWAAGQSNYFMETSTEKDQNGVFNFRGHLKEEGCSGTCSNSLMINVRDVDVATSTVPVNINNALKNGTVQLANTNTKDSTKIEVIDRPRDKDYTYEIEVSGEILKLNDRETFIVATDNNATVTLTGKHNDDLLDYSLIQPLFDREKKNRLQVKIQFFNGRGLKVTLNPTPNSEVSSIEWNNGSNDKIFEIEEKPDGRISAKIIYKNGQEARFTLALGDKFTFDSINEILDLGFDYETTTLPASNPKMLNTVEINYFDEGGNRYTSLNATQNNSNVFRIEESENFKENLEGQKTKKIKFELNMNVINKEGKEINLNGSGIFALAYPS